MPTCCTFYHGAGVKCPKHDREPPKKKKYEFKPNAFVGKKSDLDKECRCGCHGVGHAFCVSCMNNHSASVSNQSTLRRGLRGTRSPMGTQAAYSRNKFLNRY